MAEPGGNGDWIGYAARAIQLARSGVDAAVTEGYRLSGETLLPAQANDCKAAIRWIRGHAKELNLNPHKIAVWCSSVGRHLSALLGTSGEIKDALL